jgi:8-oxo-dGTP pyrophosphatase MutT (NUDIX family)
MISRRHVARLVILDAIGTLLLVRYHDGRPGRPAHYWATPGGALEPGESHLDAARRELLEETGLSTPVGRELWESRCRIDHASGAVDQHERFFLVQLDAVAPAVRNTSSEDIRELRWWPIATVRTTAEVVFPEGLLNSLAEAGVSLSAADSSGRPSSRR